MSSRALKRAEAKIALEDAHSEQDKDILPASYSCSNAFDLLENDEQHVNSNTTQALEEDLVGQNTSKPKKNDAKKKKQSTLVAKKTLKNSDDWDDESIEALAKRLHQSSLNKNQVENDKHKSVLPSSTILDPYNGLFKIDPDKLDANSELRRKFSGPSKASWPTSSRRKRSSPWIIAGPLPVGSPKPTNTQLGFGFVQDSKACPFSDLPCYSFVPTASYQKDREILYARIHHHDIDGVAKLLARSPFMVEALLVYSDALRGPAGDVSAADALLVRAINVLERVIVLSQGSIDLTQGTLRIAYINSENRIFHLLLFRQVQSLIRRGCWDCALETNKFLFSLDPLTDPLASRLFTDFLTLHAGYYEYFERLVGFEETEVKAVQMPGWRFSLALSTYLKNPSDRKGSSELLIEACKAFPSVVPLLAKACQIELAPKFYEYYAEDMAMLGANNETYLQYILDAGKIFVGRCGPLWNSQPVVEWLRTTLSSWIDSNAFNSQSYTPPTMQNLQKQQMSLAHLAPLHRHAMITDLPLLNISLPTSLAQFDVDALNPLPPELCDELDEIKEDQTKVRKGGIFGIWHHIVNYLH